MQRDVLAPHLCAARASRHGHRVRRRGLAGGGIGPAVAARSNSVAVAGDILSGSLFVAHFLRTSKAECRGHGTGLDQLSSETVIDRCCQG